MKPKDTYEIDRHRLHMEWERQPKLFHEAAEKLAEADSEVDRLKGVLELTEARIELEIRKEPTAFGIKGRVTDKAIEKLIVLDDDYQEALENYHKARRLARHLKAEVDYLGHRKTAIEYLSKLRLADYFADPRISGDERAVDVESARERAFKKTRG